MIGLTTVKLTSKSVKSPKGQKTTKYIGRNIDKLKGKRVLRIKKK